MAQDSPVKPSQEVLESPGWQTHAKWVGEKVTQAREEGIRAGLENQTAAAIIANLYHECEVLDKKLRRLQTRMCTWTEQQDFADVTWVSECGRTWVFTEGDTVENEVNFCQGCGAAVHIGP